MKVHIVAKTRRGAGACVGAITEEGRSARLIAADAAANEHAGLEYDVGQIWEIESQADPLIKPPHVENIVVLRSRRVGSSVRLEELIRRWLPPVHGGPEKLFDARARATSNGGLYISEQTGLPSRSTMFWVPDKALHLDCESKRIRYRYPTQEGGRTLTFVGFQEPLEVIPAGTLLRVSLAHWWRPKDKPEVELRCFVQLSGWFPMDLAPVPHGSRSVTPPSFGPEGQGQKGLGPSAPDGLARARQILKGTFGFSEFLPVQASVIARVLERRDTLAVMPTGGGKSLCYQLPALVFEGLTVVVSPLIALMEDQVRQLRKIGVPAAFLNYTLSNEEYVAITHHIRQGAIRILYVAPETLQRPETILLLEQSRLACFAVDEAHCVSEWGPDFRPEYGKLDEVRRRFPQVVCLALTATATPRVRQDIRRLLGISGEFVASFNRPNLFLSVQARQQDGFAQTLAFLEKHRGHSGIIYCGTRKQTDELTANLNASGWPALPYHAGLDAETRSQNQGRFIGDEVKVMVATVAFGMGINKANVRFVIHYHLPKDIESYYQEIGRAGRDGLPADALLIYSRADAMLHQYFIDKGAEGERAGRKARLNALMGYAEARECRRIPLLAYFDEKWNQTCGCCDNCARTRASNPTLDVTTEAWQFLSCVKHTGQVFGAAHIIAVLRGSRSQRLLSRGHDRLSTYGVGRDHSEERWREMAQEFVRAGLLNREIEFGGLSIAENGWSVLKGEKFLMEPSQPKPGLIADCPPSAVLLRRTGGLRIADWGEVAGAPKVIRGPDQAMAKLFSGGQTLDAIARQYGVTQDTVVRHLQRFCDAGGGLDPARVLAFSSLSAPDRARVLSAFSRLGLDRLAPIYQACSGAVPYSELHLLRLYLKCLKGDQE